MLAAKNSVFSFGEGLYKFAMRGRHVDLASSTYKRVSSRDFMNADDKEETSVHGTGKDISNPSWRHSLPHVLVATLSSFLFGYHLGVVNETLESISLDLGFNGNTMAEGLVVSTCLGGAFVGSIFSGWIADGVGRRRAFQLSALPMIIGASMSATAKDLWRMLLGRLFVGTGMGLGPPVASLYVAEVSPAYVRGTYGSLTQIATCLGLMGALFTGLPAKDTVGWWRICFAVSAAPAAVLALFMEFSAESPLWLLKASFVAFPPDVYVVLQQENLRATEPGVLFTGVAWRNIMLFPLYTPFIRHLPSDVYHYFLEKSYLMRGRGAEAEVEFEKLVGRSHVKSAMVELAKSDRGEEVEKVRMSELLYGRHSKVVFIGSTLFALQQLSGINAVFYFSSAVFKSAGVPSDSANICVGVCNLFGSIVATLLMDKLGRKMLLLGSFSGMAMSMVLQSISASSFVPSSVELYLSVGGMLLFVLTFALGAGPVPSLLLSEILPNRIRAKAMAVCMAVHWVINFFVGLLFLRLLEQIGPLVLYSIFASFCLLAVIFVKKNVLETKGKSLQEIEISLLPPE